MSIKLAVLENKEQVIADIKELVDDDKPVGYIFNKPHRVYAEQKFFLKIVKKKVDLLK